MFEAPHSAAPVPQLSNYIQPDLNYGLRIWWAFYWRTALTSGSLIVAFTILLRRFFDDRTASASLVHAIALLSRFDAPIFYYLVSFFMMAYLLRKKFEHFRIGLLSNHGGEEATLLPPTLGRTARVWWTFFWRTLVYRIIFTFFVSFPLGWTMGFLAHFLPGLASSGLINLATQAVLDGAVGIFVIYSNILDEDITDFRVVLLPCPAPTGTLATTADAAPS